MDLTAEREGVEPHKRKKWSKVLDAFGALAFAAAPLYSTFIQQIDGVSCPACLLTLHCALSRRVVKGILQVPQDRLWLLREMEEATLYFSRSKSASTPRNPAVHWEVAQMYPELKSVDPVDACFSCDGAKCLVISQLTIGILGILRRHCVPLATDPHTTTGVNSRSSNNSRHTRTGFNSRSNSNSSKVGRPELAQPNTNLRLTQDGRMQGTMKNLTFVARDVS